MNKSGSILFSVVIPVYDVHNLLSDCINSVIDQKLDNLEIILINDCSNDQSGKICDRFSNQYDFIYVVHNKKNLGVAISRNIGIKLAKGDYIIFLDSDDYFLQNSLKRFSIFIQKRKNTDVIITKFVSTRGYGIFEKNNIYNKKSIDKKKSKDVIKYIQNKLKSQSSMLFGHCWCYVIKRKFLIKNNLFFENIVIYEDQLFVSKLLCISESFLYFDKCFYCYKFRQGSLSHRNDLQASIACVQSVVQLLIFYKKKGLSKDKKNFIKSRIITTLSYILPRLINHSDKELNSISSVFKKNIKCFRFFSNNLTNNNLTNYLNYFNIKKGLRKYKEFLITEIIKTFYKNKASKIIFFSQNILTKNLINIFKERGIKIYGVLDNDVHATNKKFSGIKRYSPNSFIKKKSIMNLLDYEVFISNQNYLVICKIRNQLIQMGFCKEKISYKILSNIL